MLDEQKDAPIEIEVWQAGGTNFTSLLLTLISKADRGNLERLRMAFPYQVKMLEDWRGVPLIPIC